MTGATSAEHPITRAKIHKMLLEREFMGHLTGAPYNTSRECLNITSHSKEDRAGDK
jgi:hypothetical protein